MTALQRISRAAVLAALCLAFVPARAEPAFPILSQGTRVLPVIATHGMVVSQEAKASAIGVDVLRRGGNAVDAAVAVGFALAVTLPRAGNLGGGGFMLVHLAHEKKDVAIDYRETAPQDTPAGVFLDGDGNAVAEKSRSSGLGVGVPGTVAGLSLALERYGSGRFRLAELLAPAIRMAGDGILVDGDLADSLSGAAARLRRWPSSAALFLQADGSALRPGDRLVQRDLAASLRSIAEGGPRAFYEGETGRRIVAAVRAAGGRMTEADMAAYHPVERAPLRGTYRGYDIVSMPPPSSGGVHVIELLNVLEGYPLARMGPDSAATIHLLAEAMKLAYADRAEYLGDPDAVEVPTTGLIAKAYAERLRQAMSLDAVTPSKAVRPIAPLPYESNETTHFSVVDADGNAVANTYTLNFSYGLGLVAEGTGIILNNELDDFAAKPGVPNAYGLTGGAANAPAPRKRPLSSMAPTMVFKDGELALVTGSPGGSRIITIVLETILAILDFGLNPAEAADLPRVHHQWLPDKLYVERGLSPDTIELLEKSGYEVVVAPAWGSSQTIMRQDGLLLGAADGRQRGTAAIGY